MSYNRSEKTTIASLSAPPDRFYRSAHLEKDFYDESSLDGYVVTPFIRAALQRLERGLLEGSGRRAWRITGDFGAGKSSFALLVARMLGGSKTDSLNILGGDLGMDLGLAIRLFPVLVTGSREGMARAIARGVAFALSSNLGEVSRLAERLDELRIVAEGTVESGDSNDLISLVDTLRRALADTGAGLLIVVDELGTLLEHAASHPKEADVYVLQRLAETAVRSGPNPFVLVGVLHQGFGAYAERLSTQVRVEWDKVAERFEEIVFDQPLSHTAELVSGALGVDVLKFPENLRSAALDVSREAAETGWFGPDFAGTAIDASSIYPLHPSVLPVLLRFFSRFGQHERSLFGFLLSSEPFGLQAYALQDVSPSRWYRLDNFYDYVRAVYGHRLAGSSHRTAWLRIMGTIDSMSDLADVELRLLKAVGILNLVDAEDLVMNDLSLAKTVLFEGGEDEATSVLSRLVARNALFRRGNRGGYRLWPNTSIDLETAYRAASQALGERPSVGRDLRTHVPATPLAASRHYLETGTLRYFDVLPLACDDLPEELPESAADGSIVLVLCDSEEHHDDGSRWAMRVGESSNLLFCVTPPLAVVRPELQEVQAWQWVLENTPELASDTFAHEEASRQMAIASEALRRKVEPLVGLSNRAACGGAVFYHRGGVLEGKEGLPTTSILSTICKEVYSAAPLIVNELLNRNLLSSAASAARARLIEGMFTSADKPLLGIPPEKNPPEKSMYLSVIEKGRIHRSQNGRFFVEEPAEHDDPLRLRPVLLHLVHQLESAKGGRMGADKLLASFRRPPYGVREGVGILLLAIILRSRRHEIAVYENGTYLHTFGPADFLRLTKRPSSFDLQLYRIKGVHAEVFRRLLDAFAEAGGRRPHQDLLDVVAPLCRFAASLPECTRRSTSLSVATIRVRDTLLSGREPAIMLFDDLPTSCGLPPFTDVQEGWAEEADVFVRSLTVSIEELRDHYPALVVGMLESLRNAFGQAEEMWRAGVARRADRIVRLAREPRLRAFALRLSDAALADGPWIESVASFVVNKPPSRWSGSDEIKWVEELHRLTDTFAHVEALSFSEDTGHPSDAVRLGMTRGDGYERVSVVEPRPEVGALVDSAVTSLRATLPSSREIRLAALARLLWQDLAGADDAVEGENP